MKTCFCGNNKAYSECCGLIHDGDKDATTAEGLMRSRYSAFVLAKGDYLINSQAPQTRDLESKEQTEKWAKSVKWLKLEIIDTIEGGIENTTGIVEFKAYYKYKIFNRCIHERSNFIKKNNKWFYLNGDHI